MGVVQEEVFAMGFRSFTLNGCREFREEHPEQFSRIDLVRRPDNRPLLNNIATHSRQSTVARATLFPLWS
jgi:hypothetical protein